MFILKCKNQVDYVDGTPIFCLHKFEHEIPYPVEVESKYCLAFFTIKIECPKCKRAIFLDFEMKERTDERPLEGATCG